MSAKVSVKSLAANIAKNVFIMLQIFNATSKRVIQNLFKSYFTWLVIKPLTQ